MIYEKWLKTFLLLIIMFLLLYSESSVRGVPDDDDDNMMIQRLTALLHHLEASLCLQCLYMRARMSARG